MFVKLESYDWDGESSAVKSSAVPVVSVEQCEGYRIRGSVLWINRGKGPGGDDTCFDLSEPAGSAVEVYVLNDTGRTIDHMTFYNPPKPGQAMSAPSLGQPVAG